MLNKPIDKLDFWKQRIDTAQKEHYSVYVTGEEDWKRINTAHKEIIEQEIDKDCIVLDAGCGYGRWSEYFSQEKYTGVDFSPDFIDKAKVKYPNYNFVVSNLKSLPFEDKQFDWSFCVSIKKMIEDNLGEEEWEQIKEELKRVSNKVLILEYEDPNPFEIL